MKRREFVRTAGGATAVAAAGAGATGTVAAQELQPVWPSAVTGANLGTYQDARGESEVTVQVGAGDSGLAFDATKLWVDPGTTITFEWTGNGGAHNVQNVEGRPASTAVIRSARRVRPTSTRQARRTWGLPLRASHRGRHARRPRRR